MIKLGPEPEGMLLQRADVLEWVPGYGPKRWKKLLPFLAKVQVEGCSRPFYAKEEIRRKVVDPIRVANAKQQPNEDKTKP